ncbi:MAG: processing protein DprA [Herbaspirillum sp.]|jgi:DNA processing protein|nr:processing protein DprA [Herbaspirillum sp.]
MKNFITAVNTTAAQSDAESVSAWIRLAHTRGGPGASAARRLLTQFGLPQHIFHADRAALRTTAGARQADALLAAPSSATLDLIDRTLAWLAAPDHYLLTLADAAYPPALLTIADPPLLLYAIGRPALLQRAAVAVVGSRNASRQGLLHAEQFSEALSRAGWTVVSGMALGIDSAAHGGGLRGSGSTVAVIGTGADLVYPTRNRALAERIAQQGCIVSEYPLATPPIGANFPRRNRLISGLAGGVLVVEAALRSGSLITARVAAEQGRDVWAVPGSIHSPLSKGCHELIKQGAKLIETVQDVLEELAPGGVADGGQGRLALPPAVLPAEEESGLLRQMGFDPVSLDQLALRSGLCAAALQGELLTLELDGRVELLSGGAYRRID